METSKNRRKFGCKLKDELSIVSTATEVQGQEMMIMKHVSQSREREKYRDKDEASWNRCRCPAGASRWYGHQEETTTANIENKTAEVGSTSSDVASERRQKVQMAQFLQKEIDTQNSRSHHRDRCDSFSSAADGAAAVPAAGPAAAVPDKFRRQSNLLGVKRIGIGLNKKDSDTAGSKQDRCDEISSEMKSMLI